MNASIVMSVAIGVLVVAMVTLLALAMARGGKRADEHAQRVLERHRKRQK